MRTRSVWPALLRTALLLPAFLPLLAGKALAQHDPASEEHPLRELAFLEGSWSGRIEGTLGSGTGERQYRFIVSDRFLLMTHASYRAPQERTPEGEAHEEWSIFSFDSERNVIVLREFVTEGFVTRYACALDTEPLRLACESEATEGGSGLFLRVVNEFSDRDHFTEIFEIFGSDGELRVRLENRWRRTSTTATAPAGAAALVPVLRSEDRLRLAEAFGLAADLDDCLWPGSSAVPFAVLLVDGEREYLVRHPAPSDDFTPLGYDSLLGGTVYVRERVFSPELLATFPAVGGIPTVVIGRPEVTGKSSTYWVLTALHEHFHQLQYSQPNYYEEVNALDLSGGDETGMWMLDYPFPYDDARVGEALRAYGALLQQLLDAVYTPQADSLFRAVLDARVSLRETLSEPDDRYLSFQLWQEGVARYIEYRAAQAAAGRRTPVPGFERLPDFVPYAEAMNTLREALVEELAELNVRSSKRVAFYSLGAAQALVLDLMQPDWRRRYFEEKFTLEPR
ncbi:MAG: hypothetical protein JSV95_06085 [Gemmatimonadota bacterium]|nr:MAG: hypothetical protein JSV95_06085 [Gemmatimonadota bacterium]